jgi:hypothetical protein
LVRKAFWLGPWKSSTPIFAIESIMAFQVGVSTTWKGILHL